MGKLRQIQTAVAASFGTLITGMLYVWPSYTLSLYKAENNTVLMEPMSDFECSMLGSIPSLGAMVGTAVAGPIIERFGRKIGGLSLALPIVICWGITEFASSSLPILIGRCLGGMSGGAFLVFSPMFISEVAEDSIRGTLASGPIFFYCFGTLVSYLMGWFLSYQMIIILNIAMSVFCGAFLMTVVESPVYLMRQNREEEARQSIALYRGVSTSSKTVIEEMSKLKQQLLPAVELVSVTESETKPEEAEREKLNNDEQVPVEVEKMSKLKLLFTSPSSRQGFIVVGTALTLQVFMGIVPVQVYAKELFTIAVPDMSSHVCSVLLAVVMVLGAMISGVLADKTGRRFLIIASSVCVGACMITLAILLQVGGFAMASATALLAYCFFFNVGAGSIPYILLAECFVPEVQSLASMLLVEWIWFLNFLILGIFPYLVKWFHFYGICYIFTAASVINAICCFILVPETKGLSNLMIQEALLRRKK